MRKIYKNQLPKNTEVKSFNTKVVNGEIVVKVELKESFKDGDFLVDKEDNTVFIYSDKPSVDNETVCAYCGSYDGNDGIQTKFSNNWIWIKNCRYATKEEKEAFLEKLEKEYHKKWNPKKKCLEDIYIPKFGDIVRIEYPDINVFKRNYVISIFPNKKVPVKNSDCFFDIATINMDGDINIKNSHAAYNYNHVFLASESEKQELFDKLAEAGKRWNPKTKELEDIRWKPKPGEHFWYITTLGDIAFTGYIKGYPLDEQLISINNCFKTKRIAEKEAEKFKEFLKNSKVE